MRTNILSIACIVAVIFVVNAVRSDETPFVPDEGFISLFDGKSLTGWVGSLDGYAVEEGNLVCVAGGKGNLQTESEFNDFIVRFEFKLSEGANNGLGIRCPQQPEGNLHLDGIELQILDDSAEKYKALKPYQYHGSIYGIVAAKQGSLKPVGEWNQQEVTVQGRQIKVVVNGKLVIDADLDEAVKSGTLDGQMHPGLSRMRGHLGLLGHGDRVDFRNIQLKPIPLTHTSDSLDLVKQRLADKRAVLLDVRETTEWNEGHIDGAISLPITSLQESLQKGLDADALAKIVPKDKIIYTHCRAGRRALNAAEILSKRGFDVRPLKPGIKELFDSGFSKAK